MIVFAGPSVSTDGRARHSSIEWRPPAVAGDLLALVATRPDKVLLVDGLFDERASVKHKEALALMGAGTTLYGATSMGALRAAELEAFGMIPLGSISRAYCDGRLVGDDEVALVHADQRLGWKAVSVAMVDVRATLASAMRLGLIDRETAKTLRTRWHDIHFVDRDWPRMVEVADGIVPREVAQAIANAHVPLKERDAAAAIDFALLDAGRPISHSVETGTWFYDRLAEGLTCRSDPASRA